MTTLKAIWEWIKKHAVLFVGLLGAIASIALGFFLGRKRVVVDVQPTPGPSDKQQELDKKTAEEIKKLEEQKNAEQNKIRDQHDTIIDNQVKELEKKTPELLDDPDKLNEHLKDVGKKVRDG